MSQTEPMRIPGQPRLCSYTSGVHVTLKLAQHEASERGHSVRPVYLLLAAARMEKEVSGYVFERMGVTPQIIASFLDTQGEKREHASDNRVGFTPQVMGLLDAAARMAERCGHKIIDGYYLTRVLAESDDEEVQTIFTLCGTTGPLIMNCLLARMKDKGRFFDR